MKAEYSQQYLAMLKQRQNVMANCDFHLLRFLMSHFLQLCQLQIGRGIMEPPTLLIQSFCHVLLRPPWEKIV